MSDYNHIAVIKKYYLLLLDSINSMSGSIDVDEVTSIKENIDTIIELMDKIESEINDLEIQYEEMQNSISIMNDEFE